MELRDALSAVVHLVPCACPAHRTQPRASAQERLQMARLGLGEESDIVVDDRELRRGGVSYMVDTLADLRHEVGEEEPLVLVVGADAFNGLASWHRWLEIPQLAHIMVLERPGWSISDQPQLRELLTKRQVASVQDLSRRPAGSILLAAFSRLDIASSGIRACIEAGRSPRFLLPDSVWRYIQAHQLYFRPPASGSVQPFVQTSTPSGGG